MSTRAIAWFYAKILVLLLLTGTPVQVSSCRLSTLCCRTQVRAAHFISVPHLLVHTHDLFDITTKHMRDDGALRELFDSCCVSLAEDLNRRRPEQKEEALNNLYHFMILTHVRGRVKDKAKVWVNEEIANTKKARSAARRTRKNAARKD